MANRANPALGLAALAVLAACATTVFAQTPYKVIGADGRVTYTDRPPIGNPDSRIAPLPAPAQASSETPVLPLELRQAAARYPVTLYVTGEDCTPCAAARDFLRQRGVPFAERTVLTDEDAQALEKLSGGREAPTLTLGAQVLRGLTTSTWDEYLDAAGYPRESRLPANYRYPPATPLVARAAPAASAPATDLPINLPSLPASSGPIRF